MIRLNRVQTKAAIPAVFRGVKRVDKALTLLVDDGVKREFDSDYWKKAKKQLKIEASNKCAYCEAPTAVVAHGDVEHFRPKSVYWWLAYCYDNYLFSCQICNQSYKGDRFPLPVGKPPMVAPTLIPGATDAEKREFVRRFAPDPFEDGDGQPWADFKAICQAEDCDLINPYMEDPESRFTWEADAVLKEVRLVAKDDASQRYHKAAEECYGLNRVELRTERWKTYRLLEMFAAAFHSTQIDTVLRTDIGNMLQEMMSQSAPFAGMSRYFVRQVWQLTL